MTVYWLVKPVPHLITEMMMDCEKLLHCHRSHAVCYRIKAGSPRCEADMIIQE
jgi:hypothetical protein